MRPLLIALAIAGCGGGASIVTEPSVAIASRSCSVNSLGLLVVNVDYQVSLDPGQGFGATVEVLGSNVSQENISFFCNGWSATPGNAGCQRDNRSQPDTVTVEHFFNGQLPSPMPSSVHVTGSALLMPGSDTMIANDAETLPCPMAP